MTGSHALMRQRRRLSAAGRRVRRAVVPRVSNASLVLLYHRAAHDSVDPWRLAVQPNHLSEHLEILAAHTRPTTAAGLQRARDSRRIPPRTTLVTFDDGYADLASEVAPRLEAAGVPATMFVASGAIDRDREFWWDALARALLGPERGSGVLRLDIAGRTHDWELTDDAQRGGVHRHVWASLRDCPPTERDHLAEEVLAWAGLPAEARESHRTLRSAELDRLARDDLIEIGAHTVNHPRLAALSPEGQQREIEDSRSALEAFVSRPVTSFAYPHGGPDDVGSTTPGWVRAAGFGTAYLATPGRLRARSDPYRLPRLFVEDMDGAGFAALLWRYAGIKVS
jgi:peptidoglycan/xylan/chitin deacetylase (PgdA/CDA1 family)